MGGMGKMGGKSGMGRLVHGPRLATRTDCHAYAPPHRTG
jgi:hypothetical protein